MPIIYPIAILKNNPEYISDICHKKKEPVFITKDGFEDMVVLDVLQYEEIKKLAYANSALAETTDNIKVRPEEEPKDQFKDEGIEKIPLEDVMDIMKEELEKLKNTQGIKKRFR